MESVECLVVGAGVIGLAIAKTLAEQGREVIIIEEAEAFGTGISARNSEVIHAGIYYAQGSLKARFCVEGKNRLYDYCQSRGIEHKRLGKLIVAPNATQQGALLELRDKATANGIGDLQLLDHKAVHRLEPQIKAHTALLSPSSGIVDTHGLMLAFLGDLESHGGGLALNSPLIGGSAKENGIHVQIGGADPITLACKTFVNSAGLSAQMVASSIKGVPPTTIPKRYLAKGNYFSLQGKSPFTHLIYPLPEPGGLGTHLTLDMGGQARFGPDVEWVETENYEVDPARGGKFYQAIRTYWPDLPNNSLIPAYAGIRPKISGKGEPALDFNLQGPSTHGIPGLVNLYGIESPGLTSCLVIAENVAEMLK